MSYVYDKIGTPLDLGELAFVTVVNAVTNMLWGDTLQGGEERTNIKAELKKLLAEQMVLFGKPNVSDFFPVLARFDLQGIEKKSKRNFQWFERILDSAIEKRMNSDTGKEEETGKIEQRKDLLQILLKLSEQNDSATSISITQVKALLWVCPILYFVLN